MSDFKLTSISDGVQLVDIKTNRFKTNDISISFCTQLESEKKASANAVLISLLSRTNCHYRTISEFNKKLGALYGAQISGVVSKSAENQVLTVICSCIADKFAFDDVKISKEVFQLLIDLIFHPNVDENGYFYQSDIDREKRVVAEKLEAEKNEKRVYSLRQLEKNMFKDEPYSINAYGNIEAVKNLTKEDLKSALDNLVKTARVQIVTIGNADTASIIDLAQNSFGKINRAYKPLKPAVFIPKADKVNTVEERIPVKQGKLLLGFRVNAVPDDELTSAMRAFCDIFGGGPYSKLFANVREKLSLCYYCSARYDRRKSNIIIQCGCEEENMDKAIDEILAQLAEIANGNFDEEFKSSKMGLTDSIISVDDDIMSASSWYLSQIADDDIVSPKESADRHMRVSKAEVMECANRLSLDTIYKLVSTKEGE